MKKTILSLEQALTLPYATQRFVQLGWRVIRVEGTAGKGNSKPGDPNRYIGEEAGGEDLHAYFIAPNLGKEAITLNLKTKEGQQLLKTLIKKLHVDIFFCNTLPKRYKQLGINFESLREANPDLIWCGISAFGPDYPDRAGYDPALQALLGYMFLTGEPDRDPMLCGLPIIDLKAGDEAYTQVLLALLEQQNKARESHAGKEIHISMAQCAASWLITALPQLQFANDKSKVFTRSGNEHRSFIPSNCYPTKDGHVYLAIGSDSQWEKLIKINGFDHLRQPQRMTNNGRMEDKENIYTDIRQGLQHYTTTEFIEQCLAMNLSVAPVNSTTDVVQLKFVKDNMIETTLPHSSNPDTNGRDVKLFPAPMMTDFLVKNNYHLECAPRLGEHTESILKEAGFTAEEIDRLRNEEII